MIECGLHSGLSEERYHGLPLASAHNLGNVLRSAAHAKHAMDNPDEPTPELRFGRAFHCFALEGHSAFREKFAVAGPCVAKLKSNGAVCGCPGKFLVADEWLCGKHVTVNAVIDTRTIIAADDFDRIRRMNDALVAHPRAADLLMFSPAREISFIWDDADSDVRCKMRADLICESVQIVADLKTCANAAPDAFARAAASYGYQLQGAHYLAGAQHMTPAAAFDTYCFIAVEKEPPFGVAVYKLDEEDVAAGHRMRAKALKIWRECIESGKWPGYPEDVIRIEMPRWVRDLSEFELA